MTSNVEQILNQAKALPIYEVQSIIHALAKYVEQVKTDKQILSDHEFAQQLRASGLVVRVPQMPINRRKRNISDLIHIKGKPLSETIIEDRR